MTKIAGGEIVWGDQKFNWGDEVPDELVAAHPEWVVDKPLSVEDIDQMSPDEMKAELLRLSGREESAETVVAAEEDEG